VFIKVIIKKCGKKVYLNKSLKTLGRYANFFFENKACCKAIKNSLGWDFFIKSI
jgi:hypothetical protein